MDDGTPEGAEGARRPEQLALRGVPARRRPRRPRAPVPIAEQQPVARVVVDRPQPHLDRPFDYAVPATMADDAAPGVRVRVRFGGQDLDGYVLERRDTADHDGPLVPLRRVVSPEAVLTDDVLAVARAVAARYAGGLADVLRLAVPPRHARVEQESWPGPETERPERPERRAPGPGIPPGADERQDDGPDGGPAGDPWADYTGGAAFLRRVGSGEAPRAVWQALPGDAGRHWADAVSAAVRAVLGAGRGAVVVVPSADEVLQLEAALGRAGVPGWRPGRAGGWVRLTADDGPAARYRAFLAVLRGAATVAIGTRAAAFAPVREPGLLVCWDDGDPLHAEPRAPYPHAREVLALRSELHRSALLVGGHVPSVTAQRWLVTGWAHALAAPRAVVRRRTPRVVALTSVELAREGPAAGARLPSPAWRAVRDGLERGPVLVQVPRAGYVPATACGRCRTVARCPDCHGPLQLPARDSPPACRWCGRLAGDWRCPECGATTLRSVRVGSERTAEELGRAFPGARVRVSAASSTVIREVSAEPAVVVATPGAEPRAEGGYAAALLLDPAVLTGRPELDAGVRALRTWIGAAALVRPATQGGVVLLVGDAAPAPSQALVRWDPGGLARRELDDRLELGLPPAVHLVSLEGERAAVDALLARVELPRASTVLGPLPLDDAEPGPAASAPTLLDPDAGRQVRALVRTPWSRSTQVVERVRAAVVTLSARRDVTPVRTRVEPADPY